ncbi:unnamed protein product, partial [Symbiodinium microadriaticum]
PEGDDNQQADAEKWKDDQWSSWSSSWSSAYQAYGYTTPEPLMPELLPDYVQGWYLLHDSGLSGHERNVVQTALQGDFSVARVAQELRNQCAVLDSQRRDLGGRGSSYLGDIQEEEIGEMEAPNDSFLGDIPDEEMENWETAENEAQEAMAAMHNAKRTLKEARQRQNNVRLSRQYFRTNGGGSQSSAPKPRDDSKIHCLRCGQLGHRVANCPQPPQGAQSAKTAEQVDATSSFICYNDVVAEHCGMASEGELAYAQGVSTAEAVSQGKAVIDGGATRTLASCAAMEAIMTLNNRKKGHSGLLKLDKKDCPIFGFGNGETNKCTATVQLAIKADTKPGALTVHCLDQGSGPLLLSVDTLRRLKAVIDFSEDLVCFRALDVGKLIPLERSQTGHQLLPVTEDLYKNRDVKGPEPPEHGVKNNLSTAAHGSHLEFKSAVFCSVNGRDVIKNVNVQLPTSFQEILVTMPRATTKESLRAELLMAGEDVPTRWTKMDMEQRLRELREQGLADSEETSSLTTMEQWNKDFRKAARKKATLVEFCRDKLGFETTGNEVMATLESRALKIIMAKAPAEPGDYVGFGKHAKERYQTILAQYPDYAKWVVTMYQESGEDGVDIRLARLAKWLLGQKSGPLKEPKEPPNTQGYMMTSKGTEKTSYRGGRSSSAARGNRDAPEDVDKNAKERDRQMAAMVETLALLRAEVAEMKSERPRKTVAKAEDEGMTDNSFNLISDG